ncbi:hypothetical protein OWR29_25660 [Actinoplanes sp. Pm04-4]|uniref:Transmembrane protein n=1 Tax=Paractinoplanes pyxinae TaxID=2997416 RepID=A0ABT4B6D4_9ACTN|nr:hypothetical protein [Actinoplanes pyxinae]MCY1141400.1 hypothetical protein [Actinoplanes pyxinae]
MLQVSIELPRVGRRRGILALVLAGIAAALWIYGAAQLSAARAMYLHILVGLAVPFGVAYVSLLLIEWRIREWGSRADRVEPKAKAKTALKEKVAAR